MRRVWLLALCVALCFGQVSISPRRVKLEGGECTYAEFPCVAAVFFDSGSDVVHERFDGFLREVVRRLSQNPDVVVEVRGYYHPAGDGALGSADLATRRAKSVRERMLAFDASVAERVLVQPSVDPTALRRGQLNSLDAKIQQENQRAELSARCIEEIRVDAASPDDLLDRLHEGSTLYRIERTLLDNPLVVGVVFGDNICSKGATGVGYKVLDELRSRLVKRLSPAAAERIYIALRWTESGAKGYSFVLTAEPLSEKPFGFGGASGFGGTNPVEVDAEGTEPLELALFRCDGLCAVGFGADDRAAVRIEDLPSPLWSYRASALVRTPAGHAERLWSKPLEFKLGEEVSCSERLVLALYRLDQLSAPQSPAVCAARDAIARHIARLARKNAVSVVVSGHTDDIGDDEKSRQMSLFWAEREREILAGLVAFYLGVAPQKLSDAGVELSAVGRAYAVPAAAGSLRADGSTPEGRCALRRVEVEISLRR